MKPGDRVRLSRKTNNTVGRAERFFTRLGTVQPGVYRQTRNTVRVLWDGCKCPEKYHVRLLEVSDAH
jgi:hypothetical protein